MSLISWAASSRGSGWRAIVATDFLIKMLHQTRPYELDPGETDRVYAAQLARIEATIEKGGDAVFSALSEAVGGFLAIPKTESKSPWWGSSGRSTYARTGTATMTS